VVPVHLHQLSKIFLMANEVAQLLIKVFKPEINKVQEMEEEAEINKTDLYLLQILVNKLGNKGKH